MKKPIKILYAGFLAGLPILSLAIFETANAKSSLSHNHEIYAAPGDSAKTDTATKVKTNTKWFKPYSNPISLKLPPSYKTGYEFDTTTRKGYIKNTKLGNTKLTPGEEVSIDDYRKEQEKKSNKAYFQKRSQAQNYIKSGGGFLDKFKLDTTDLLKKILGKVEIKPAGSAELTFGGNFNTVRNPQFTARQQKNGQFVFTQKIQLNVTGSIGDQFKINTNYNTDAIFDFENLMKVNWQGKPDQIVKSVEVGNVSMPLNGTLIQGGMNLFGAKVKLQFGKLTTTVLFSQQKGKSQEVELQGGAQVTPFDIQCDQYDPNRHYFLSQDFRDHYERWLSRPPLVQSEIQITRIEVWVTNKTGAFENARDIIGFMDLAENKTNYIYRKSAIQANNSQAPGNDANTLYGNLKSNPSIRSTFRCIKELESNLLFKDMKQIEDYQLVNYARQLNPSEFVLNSRLGYISLNQALNNDEVLAVAYEYTYNGQVFQVGEFTRDQPANVQDPNVLFLKLLKTVSVRPDLPNWKLMMKNIYSIGSYQMQPTNFRLAILYADDPSNSDNPYIPAETDPKIYKKNLLQVMNLDRINSQNELQPDGQYDWIEGVTVNAQQGRIILPLLEPFGDYLRSKFTDPNGPLADYYAFDALYDSTRWAAQQQPLKNKFFLRGSFQGTATNEISLNAFNIPKGSVRVTYNGSPLKEGEDYQVDYSIGRVKILNTGILNSGGTIKASFENNTALSVQQKTLYGTRLDYRVNKDFILGSTLLHLRERPLIPKVGIGDEPLSNTVIGFDGTYRKDSRWITKMIDRLPLLATKEMSNFMITAEYAKIIPGVSPAIRRSLDKTGVSYLDDFEASETPYDLRVPQQSWFLASTPQGDVSQNLVFKGGDKRNELEFRSHVGKLAWYTLDPLFYRGDNLTPNHIRNNVALLSNHYVREVRANEVYPNKQIQQGYPQTLPTFDLAYFPNQRGPYNYRTDNVNNDGTFKDPQNNWAGVMRKIDNNDFEQANIDYIELWVMDPFILGHNNNVANKGQLYIHLGNVSEDLLKDSRKSFENGLPVDKNNIVNVDTTLWARVPSLPTINTNFNNDPNARYTQDVGYDGFNDEEERNFLKKSYLDTLLKYQGANSLAYAKALNDPASDNYHYYRGSDYDSNEVSIIQRQKMVNGPDGNSPSPNAAPVHQPQESYPVGITMQPNDEDINRDFTLNEVEEYYQYRIDIEKGKLKIGENYVTDSVVSPDVLLKNGNKERVTWYQFKIPIRSYEKKIGQIPDFKSIRFIRMAMSGFSDSIVMRFGALQLVRADWRKYLFSLTTPGDVNPIDPNDNTSYRVSTVNIEKNGRRQPIPYVLPPEIFRTIDPTTPNPVQQNEQSLSLFVCGLKDGDARAVFKNSHFDIRNYKKLKMFIHAEADRSEVLKDNDLSAFIRIGTDFTNNYYELEIPLKVTQPGTSNENDIWPKVNEMNVDIEEFFQLKLDRIRTNAGNSVYYEKVLANGQHISVVGIPDMSNLRVMMLGIRNPKKIDITSADDGLSKCGEVWFDELRVSGFDNPGGWAATSRVTSKLADFGTFNMTGSITTVGYGGIDKKLNERARNLTMVFDVNTNLELGKFFPAKSGVSIPFFYSYTQTILRPHFYPLNPDIPMDSILEVSTPEQAKRAKENADDFTSRRSWNLTNVRKAKTNTKKALPWDLPNFNFTYAFNEYFKHNQNITFNRIKTYQFVANWVYQLPIKKGIEPFKWVGKNKWLQLIRDINIMPLPQSYSIITQTDRRYGELQNRGNDTGASQLDILYDKNFTNKRIYDIKWDLTKALKINYNAIVQTRIDEPIGEIYTGSGEGRDSILKNIKTGGRPTDFLQQTNFSYTVPFNKLPLTNWITTGVNYGVMYNWKTAPPALGDTVGNTISNSQNISINGQFNFIQLYSKVKFLDEINKGTWLKKSNAKKTAKPKEGNRPDKKPDTGVKKPNGNDDVAAGENEEKTEEAKPSILKKVINHSVKFLLMAKNVSFTYTETNATEIPGFMPVPKYLGQDFSKSAPGLDFIFGSQSENIKYRAATNGWLTQNQYIFNQYRQATSQNFRANATLEPFPDFRIQLNMDRSYSHNFSSFFKYNDTTQKFTDFTPMEGGQFSMTYFAWPTAFKHSDTASSEVFNQMQSMRYAIAGQLQTQNPRTKGLGIDTATGFPVGYPGLQQDVLVNSFVAAYSGQDQNKYKTNLFPKMPAPNWRITWNGLTKSKKIAEYFTNISISHGYSSKYTISSYSSSLKYGTDPITSGSTSEPRLVMQSVTISEQFSPLIGIDMAMKNNFTTKFEYKKDRTMNLLTGNAQLTEQKNSEFVLGIGYRKKGLKLPFIKIQGSRGGLVLEREITFRFDFSIRDQWTTIRKFDISNGSIPTAGSKIIKIKPEINYSISENMMLRIFYDRTVTKPYTSNSFPTAITQFGVTIRYTLQ